MSKVEDRWHKWPDERPPDPEGGPGGGDGDQYLTYKSTRGLVVYSLLWWAGVRWWYADNPIDNRDDEPDGWRPILPPSLEDTP